MEPESKPDQSSDDESVRLSGRRTAILAQGHFLLKIPSVICSQWVSLCGLCLCLCCAFAIPTIVWCWCCPHFTSLALNWCSGMVSDGYQAQKRGSWIPGTERAERVLAMAISTDGRKECTCKFCSEPNVWTWSGLRALQRPAGRKTERPGVWKQRKGTPSKD